MGMSWSSEETQFEEWIDIRLETNRAVRNLKRERVKAFSEFQKQEHACFQLENEAEARVAARKAVHRANLAFLCQHKIIQFAEVQDALKRCSSSGALPANLKDALCELCDSAQELDFPSMKTQLDLIQTHFQQLKLFDDRHVLDSDELIEEFEVEQLLCKSREMRQLGDAALQDMPSVHRRGSQTLSSARSSEPAQEASDLHARLAALLRDS